MHACGAGETACGYGCLGCGDCEAACQFGAIHVNPETGIPEVNEDKCTSCGACVKACPRHIIELRKKGPKGRRVYVSCVNKDKGAVSMKACKVSCIGCGKCEKECPFGAITVEGNCSYIDFNKCRLCRKCVTVCPTKAIRDVNFPMLAPAPKPKTTAPVSEEKTTK
jgi:ferredoxin